MKRATEGVALLIALSGLALIANGLWIPAKAALAQTLIEKAWARVLAGDLRARPWPWADTWPVAHLVVPGIGEDFYVLAGSSGQSLAFGPAHVSASAKPGVADNIVIAGHRDTHFSFLRTLEIGDELILESPGGFDRYRVDATEVVHESRTDLLLPSGIAELTLITCFPFDALVPGGPLRYVVFASRSHRERIPEVRSERHERAEGFGDSLHASSWSGGRESRHRSGRPLFADAEM